MLHSPMLKPLTIFPVQRTCICSNAFQNFLHSSEKQELWNIIPNYLCWVTQSCLCLQWWRMTPTAFGQYHSTFSEFGSELRRKKEANSWESDFLHAFWTFSESHKRSLFLASSKKTFLYTCTAVAWEHKTWN